MNYHNIVKDDFLNGDGLRVTLFCSGCTHACPGCHNPNTWDKHSGILFDAYAKQELFTALEKDYIDGVTLSGGDPFATFNRAAILELMKEIKEQYPTKTIWVYTGYKKEELEAQGFWNEIKPYLDVLVDGPFRQELLAVQYEWAGSTNQRVLRKESDFMENTSSLAVNPHIPLECSCGDNDLKQEEDWERE